MKFSEIEAALPNGFCDVLLSTVNFDAVACVLHMKISVDMRNEFAPLPEHREIELTASGVSLFFMDPPQWPYPHCAGGIRASGDNAVEQLDSRTEALIEARPQHSDWYRFFFEDWNSFLYVVAEDVVYQWVQL